MEGYWNPTDSKRREAISRGYASGYAGQPLPPDANEHFESGWRRATAIVGEPQIPVVTLSKSEELKKPAKVSLF